MGSEKSCVYIIFVCKRVQMIFINNYNNSSHKKSSFFPSITSKRHHELHHRIPLIHNGRKHRIIRYPPIHLLPSLILIPNHHPIIITIHHNLKLQILPLEPIIDRRPHKNRLLVIPIRYPNGYASCLRLMMRGFVHNNLEFPVVHAELVPVEPVHGA